MTAFLYSATDAGGQRITGEIDAASLEAARFRLDERGLRDVVFHTDEMNAQIDRALELKPVGTPEQRLRARRTDSGGLGFLLQVYAGNWVVWLPLSLWVVWDLSKGPPYSWGAMLRFVLLVPGLLFPLWAALPARAYNALLDASAWARWEEVRRRCAALRRWQPLLLGRVPPFELAVRDACARAALGDLPGALAQVQAFSATVSPATIFAGRLSSVYAAARDWSEAARCQKEAMELSGGGVAQTIDYATTLVWRLRDADGAERLLAGIADKARAEMPQAFTDYAEGLIALERRQFVDAAAALGRARDVLGRYALPTVRGLADFVEAHLAIALAGLGDKARARALLRGALPRLTAYKDLELARRCAAAVA
jgi:hypothetical protein